VVAFDIYRVLWDRRLLIAALTIATVVSAYVVVSRQTKVYKSTTLIRVQQRVGDPTQVGTALGIAQHLAQTYARIVDTDATADRVYRLLHDRVPRDRVRLSAEPVQDLELLYISATSPDPKQAADVANAAPGALRQFIAEQPAVLRDEIEVINPAGASTTPVSPRVKLSLVIAFLAGLVFNSGLALLIEFLSDRLRGVEELEALTGRPVLATVPPLVFQSPGVSRLHQLLDAEPTEAPEPTALTARDPAPQPRQTSG
jgi:tyrosine-protein kinase